jgi:hypothetical protein
MRNFINKAKNFYVWGFSKIIDGFKKVVEFNKRLVTHIRLDFTEGRYILGGVKSICYCFFFIIQCLLFLLLLVSYILCKVSGICLILPF